ncbi:hypothetical protein F5X97DRAFT_320037 [Nemania serpens]|nr:hypothetical protein F5X97DRAFT_320037 [Nemania serpens]
MDQGDVFDMLPTSIRSRIPAFKSLRRSNYLSTTTSRRELTEKGTENLVVTSRLEENEVVQLNDMAAGAEVQVTTQRKEQTRVSASGIQWRYAEQCTNIHRLAHIEREGDPDFSRKSYIDGLTYALRALPANLSDQETTTILAALPPPIADMGSTRGGKRRAICWQPPPENRTLLQRLVASCVAIFVVLVHLMLSYVTVVARVGAYYERKHHISQQLAARGFVIATAVGRRSVVLSAKICAMKDGRLGRVVSSTMSSIASWTVDSVTYGVQEGIGQGRMMVDATMPRQV